LHFYGEPSFGISLHSLGCAWGYVHGRSGFGQSHADEVPEFDEFGVIGFGEGEFLEGGGIGPMGVRDTARDFALAMVKPRGSGSTSPLLQ
jgi:hypothetical protein